ncbi:MAG: hypothetical protein ACRC2V_20875 [Xenococcaceae cyanobacterium]
MHIELAGKVLSQLNSDRLKAAFVEIGKTLIAAGAISPSDLGNLFEGVAETFEDEKTLEAVAAMSLRERYKREIIWSNFRQLLSNFESMCTGILRKPSDSVDRVSAIVSDFKDTFGEILLEASAIDPSSDDSEMPYRNGLYCAKVEDSSELSANSELLDSELADIDIVFDIEEPLVLEGAIEVNSEPLNTVEAASNPNTTPLKGVLFRIDEPSESAPSKGSAYPLYIPKDVAEKAMEFVNAAKGLPLDADDSLSKHANEDIIGIMTSAEIDNSDFVVKGHLFPWSQKDKVSAIALNQNDLGMSLNGKASGNIVEMDGVKVFHLSNLEILGANILLKKRATYQKTRIYPMGEIAASATENQLTEEDMELERAIGELQKTLAEISAASTKESELVNARIQQLTDAFNGQQQLLQTIQAEREQSISAAQSQSLAAQKAEEQQQLLAAIGAVVQAQVAAQKEEIINSINPRRSPQRITQSLVGIAASGQENQQSNAVRDRLIAASGELKALEANQIIGPQRIALTDEIQSLQQRMSVS